MAIALVRSGEQVKQTVYELGINAGCLHAWLKQDRIDRGEIPGNTTAELRAARKRIRELETELAIIRQAPETPGRGQTSPKMIHPVLERSADAGPPIDVCCRALGLSRQGHYPIQAATDVSDRAPPLVADRIAPGMPRRLSWRLRLPLHPRRTDHGDGCHVQFTIDLGADGTSRNLRIVRGRHAASDYAGLSPPAIWSAASSIGCDRTSRESPTSPNIRGGRKRRSAPLSWTRSSSGSSGGRSTRSRTRLSPSTRLIWLSRIGGRRRVGSCMPITEFSSPPGLSATGSVLLVSCRPSEVSATAC